MDEREWVEWVLRVFGAEDETYSREDDARADLKFAREHGALASLYKRTITEEPINAE